MNYYSSLVKTIDKLTAEGKQVKLTKLPSVVNIKRKSIKFWFLTTTVHSLINMNQQVIFHLNDGNDIIKNEYPLTIINGLFENVDEQLCKYYNIDYQQVNTIELVSWMN